MCPAVTMELVAFDGHLALGDDGPSALQGGGQQVVPIWTLRRPPLRHLHELPGTSTPIEPVRAPAARTTGTTAPDRTAPLEA